MEAFPDFRVCWCQLGRNALETVLSFCRTLHSPPGPWGCRRLRMLGKQGASARGKGMGAEFTSSVERGKSRISVFTHSQGKFSQWHTGKGPCPIHSSSPSPQRHPLLTSVCSSSGGYHPQFQKGLWPLFHH